MVSATFKSAAQLRHIAEAIGDLISDVNLDVSSTGISIQAIDSSHVCLISIVLTGDEIFESFNSEEDGSLGINVASLIKALKCAGADDRAIINNDGQKDTLNIKLSSTDDRVVEFSLKLMVIDAEQFTITERSGSAFKLPAKDFARAVKDLAGLGDTLQIQIDNDELIMECDGDVGRAKVTFKSEVSSLNKTTKTAFSLKHLVSITKAAALTDEVTIELVDGMPMCAEFALSPSSSVKFYLAPKIIVEGDD